MAHATIKGQKHLVRMVSDLGPSNWSLEIYPEPPPDAEKRQDFYKTWPVPLVMKLFAHSKEHALLAGLEHLKKLGRIDDFHVEESERPPPPPPPAAPKPPVAASAPPAAAPEPSKR